MPDRLKSALPPDQSSWDTFIDHAFSSLMGTPTNKLSRAPAFKQFYWKRVAELTPYMDETTRVATIKAAGAAGFDEATFRNITRDALSGHADTAIHQAGFTGGGLIQDINDVDDIAKAFALEETKDLLYDLSRRRDVTDITRNIFPFAEAWSEIYTRWFRIMRENPDTLRRFQQTIEGARGSGFFYENENGEEVFAYPGGHLIAAGLFSLGEGGPFGGGIEGASLTMEGRVAGLNLAAGSYMPGFGPVITTPAAMVLPGNAEFNGIRDLLFPFGEPDTSGPGALLESFIPAWAMKIVTPIWRNNPERHRLYANTVTDVFNLMNLQGDITGTDPESVAKDWDRARKIATGLWLVRGFTQGVGPTGPSIKLEAEDQNGVWYGLATLADKYRELLDENRGNDAVALEEFTNQFGFDPLGTLGLATSKTERVRPSGFTKDSRTFEQRNTALFNAFPNTAYYVAPDDPFEDFDYGVYLEQIRKGDRRDLTDAEWIAARNDLAGRIAYQNAQEKMLNEDGELRTDEAAKQFLRNERAALVQRFPGYQTGLAKAGKRPTNDDRVRELERWATSPAIMETQIGQAVASYMTARAKVISAAIERGHVETERGVFRAESTAYLKEWLLSIGFYIAEQAPDFAAVWKDVLMNELRIDPSDVDSILGLTPDEEPPDEARFREV
jgi:hypothetical protein